MGMTIWLAPRGGCGAEAVRSRWTCRVFGRASIFASSFLVRRRMTKMPPDGYPALQKLQSGRISDGRVVVVGFGVALRNSNAALVVQNVVQIGLRAQKAVDLP